MATEQLTVILEGEATSLDKASDKAAVALKKVEEKALELDKRLKTTEGSFNQTGNAVISYSFAAKKAEQATKRATETTISFNQAANNIKSTATQAAGSLRTVGASSNAAQNSLFALTGVIQDAPYGFRGIANNITFFTQSMAYATKASGGLIGAIKAMGSAMLGPAGVIFAISSIVSLLDAFIGNTAAATPKVDDLTDSIKDLHDEFGKSKGNIAGEIANLKSLTKAYFENNGNLQAQANIREQISKINKVYAAQLGQEVKTYKDANEALKQYQRYLIQTALVKAQSEQISKIVTEQQQKANEGAIAIGKRLVEAQKELARAQAGANRTVLPGQLSLAGTNLTAAELKVKKIREEFERFKETLSSETVKRLKPLFDQINQSTAQIASISNPFREVEDGAKKATDAVQKLGDKFKLPEIQGQKITTPGINASGVPTFISTTPPPLPLPNLTEAQKQLIAFNDLMDKSQLLVQGLGDVFGSVFSAIGDGQNAFKALEQAVVRLIEKLAEAAAISAVLSLISGGAGAVGGFSFLTAFKGLLGLPHFANGGYVNGPQLAVIGDAPGGEWVLNQQQMRAIMQGGIGNGTTHITGEFKIAGNDLKAVLSNQNIIVSRRNG